MRSSLCSTYPTVFYRYFSNRGWIKQNDVIIDSKLGPSGSGLSAARSQGNQRLLPTHPNSQNKKTLASRIHQSLVNARASISSWRKNAREPKRNARKRNKEDDWNERSRKRHKGDSR